MVPDTDVRPAGGPDIASLDFDADGVLRLEWATGAAIDGPNAQLAMDLVNGKCQGRPTPLLIDMAATGSVSRAARTVFSQACNASAIALLGASAVDRVLANFFLSVHSAPAPTRFFTSNGEAVRWLTAQGHAGG